MLIPLLKACILLDEAIKTACQKLPSEYRSRVDSVDLKESDLVAKIERADRSIGRYMDLITIEQHKDKPNYPHISRLREAESQCRDLKMKLEEKLQKLREYNSASPQLFSKIDDLYQLVQQGLSQARTSWQAGDQSFHLPNRQELAWVKVVDEKWEQSSLGIQQLIDKAESGVNLSTKEMNALGQYLVEHPQTELSDKVLNVLQYTSASNISVNYDDMEGFLNTISYGSTGVLATTEGVASYSKIKNGTWWRKPVSTTYSKTGFKTWKQVSGDVSRFKSVKSAKNVDDIINGTGQIAKGSGLKGAAKSVGILGSALAVFDGVTTYYERVDEYGQTSAAIDGVVHTTTAVGSIYVGAAVGSLIPIPVVGTVAGAAAGYIVGGLANTLYDGLAHGKWNWDNFALW